MPVLRASRISSVPRRHKLGLVLISLIGWFVTGWFWPLASNVKPPEWSGYAAAVSSIAASMVSLTVAVTALLYALLGTPLVKFLHEKGALNRLLFDLIVCAILWLVALGLSLLGALPNYSHAQIVLRVATSAAVAGLLYFVPIGNAFWLLLSHGRDKPSPVLEHDFRKPTDLT
jgi:hypothetical protein